MTVWLQSQISLDDYLGGADMLRAALDDLVFVAGGEALFGLLLGSTLVVSFWFASKRDLAPPAVIVILIGGLLFPLLPPGYVGIARTVSFIGLAAGVLAVLERYYLSGGQPQ